MTLPWRCGAARRSAAHPGIWFVAGGLWMIASFVVGLSMGCSASSDGQALPSESAGDERSAASYTVAVIPKGTTHVFWKSVEAGAMQAGRELDAEVIWKGPLKENDRAQQIQVVQQFIADRVDGIVLAPLDSKALLGPVRSAAQQNIPVVICDSALEGQPGRDFVGFVATNNMTGGILAGNHLAELLEGRGKVVLLRYMVGSASTHNREMGFEEALSAYSDVTIVSDNRYAGATAGEAQTTALNMVDQLRDADGVFCPNESSTNGMLQALRKENLAGQIKFVGFDASPPLVAALRAGEIDALVVQNPRRMGYLGVKTLIRHLEGEPVELTIDTGVKLVTGDNLDDPEVQRMIQ